jgi:hypothetical protein
MEPLVAGQVLESDFTTETRRHRGKLDQKTGGFRTWIRHEKF